LIRDSPPKKQQTGNYCIILFSLAFYYLQHISETHST